MASLPPHLQVSVLIFLKSLATPVVLYSENPMQLYEEMKGLIKAANQAAPKLIEKPGVGPLKRVCFTDTMLMGVALQSDPSVGGSVQSGPPQAGPPQAGPPQGPPPNRPPQGPPVGPPR
ncbi:MAG: hypothetical protein K2X01_08130 [Cyanobacteria bacterium]|nr:hypothetical protein [Cyanobacteriota bacterium]